MEILKNYYQIRNQQPRKHADAKFGSKQSIFKFRDQIIVKKVMEVNIFKKLLPNS